MKHLRALLALTIITVAFALSNAQNQKIKVSILGDSYSTFQGYIPEGNSIWYGTDPQYNRGNDVVRVYDTWWYQLIDRHGLALEVNESWSGSTICSTGYNGKEVTYNSFFTRADRLGNPDVILVFGGTNDMWANSPIGNYKYADWAANDLKSFRPAFCYMYARLRDLYPNALIYNIENTELKNEFYETCDVVCRHYGIIRIRLHHISKQLSHPSIDGMKSIANQVWDVIGNRIYAGQAL